MLLCVGNFHLVIVGRVSSFEAFVVALGKVTYDLASNMGTITESATAAARGVWIHWHGVLLLFRYRHVVRIYCSIDKH